VKRRDCAVKVGKTTHPLSSRWPLDWTLWATVDGLDIAYQMPGHSRQRYPT